MLPISIMRDAFLHAFYLMLLGGIASCSHYEYPSFSSDDSTTPSLSLLSPIVTRNQSASLNLSCGPWTHYQIVYANATQPTASSSGWNACHSGTLTYSLQSGPKYYYLWLKNSDTNEVASNYYGFEANYASGGYYSVSNSSSSSFGDFKENKLAVLDNGLIVSADPTAASDLGVVTIYSPAGRELNHISGTQATDKLGSGGVYSLTNGGFLISAPYADHGAAADTGALYLFSTSYDSMSGNFNLMGPTTLYGDSTSEFLGLSNSTTNKSGIYTFPDLGSVVVSCPYCTVSNGDGDTQQGKVYILNTSNLTNASNSPIGGVNPGDHLGLTSSTQQSGVIPLGSARFAIVKPDFSNGTANVGVVTFHNASNGTDIVSPISGDSLGDHFGSGGVYVLKSGDYAIVSPDFDCGFAGHTGQIKILDSNLSLVHDICQVDSTGPAKLGNLSTSNSPLNSLFSDSSGNITTLSMTAAHLLEFISYGNSSSLSHDDSPFGAGATTLNSAVATATQILQLPNDLLLMSNLDIGGGGNWGNLGVAKVSDTSSAGTNLIAPAGISNRGSGGIYYSSTSGYCGLSSPKGGTAANKGLFEIFPCYGNGISNPNDISLSSAISLTGPSTAEDFGTGGVIAHPTMKLFLLGRPNDHKLVFVPFD